MSFSMLCWNVDQARREEKEEQTKWDTRSPHVKQLIKSVKCDIVALLELRDLETSKENWRQFLSHFPEYDHVSRRYCHFELTFAMTLMVDPKKFFIGDTRLHSYSDDQQKSKIVMFVDLQCKHTLKRFTIGVTHFDLPEDIKWVSVKKLRDLISTQQYPTMVYGDYNFFDDMDGIKQREYMLETCNDVAHPLIRIDTNVPEKLSGTFIGFKHDEQKKSYEKMSRLDHIFVPRTIDKQISIAIADSPNMENYKFDNSSYESYTYPSDHLAIRVNCMLF